MPQQIMNQNDHDMLIRLDTKFDQMAFDIKILSDGTGARLALVEQKVSVHQKLIDEINPLKLAKASAAHDQFIRDFRLTWRIIVLVAGFIGALTGFLVNIAINYFQLFKHV